MRKYIDDQKRKLIVSAILTEARFTGLSSFTDDLGREIQVSYNAGNQKQTWDILTCNNAKDILNSYSEDNKGDLESLYEYLTDCFSDSEDW